MYMWDPRVLMNFFFNKAKQQVINYHTRWAAVHGRARIRMTRRRWKPRDATAQGFAATTRWARRGRPLGATCLRAASTAAGDSVGAFANCACHFHPSPIIRTTRLPYLWLHYTSLCYVYPARLHSLIHYSAHVAWRWDTLGIISRCKCEHIC